jgi:hydrogenase-4 component E
MTVPLSDAAFSQLVALSTGTLLVTSVIFVWRRSLRAAVRLLAVQGCALALLVAAVGLAEREAELLVTAVMVLVIKAVAIPVVLGRGLRADAWPREDRPRMNPTTGLLAVTLLTTLAYLVSRPITEGTGGTAAVLAGGEAEAGPAAFAVPMGITMVLVGFLLLVTRRRAVSQMIGFLLLDNGIATVAFLTAAGVPFVVELGVSLDVLLVALILAILSGRLSAVPGAAGPGELTELRD